MRSLLDINVIIALLDADHDFHHRAHRWWAGEIDNGWASCPLTENGVIRIMSHPSYNPRRILKPEDVVGLLRTFTAGSDHQFWPDSASFLDGTAIRPENVLGPRQVTDLYLLALATSRGGRLVTFDESIHRSAVVSATAANLVVI
ncbi:MAG: TA system VapC family ribonuclease toxin [Alkalispirochaeta sp.]